MTRQISFLLFALIFSCPSISAQQPFIPDKSAVYPGGMEAFYSKISTMIIYPTSARRDGSEGRMLVSFDISDRGHIVPSSVKVVLGLTMDCDSVAVRAIKEMTTRWSPAKKNGKAVPQTYVLPLIFKLSPPEVGIWPEMVSFAPAHFKIIAIRKDQVRWPVYMDWRMQNLICSIPVGDSVEVIGWAPSVFAIKYEQVYGYLPVNAIEAAGELKELVDRAREAASRIEKEEDERMANRTRMLERKWAAAFRIKPTGNRDFDATTMPQTFLRLSTNRSEVVVGECAEVELAFWVSDHNRDRLRFYNLGGQLAEWSRSLVKDNCLTGGDFIQSIKGVPTKMGDSSFTVYPIYRSAYCPVKVTPIIFPAINMQVEKIKPPPGEERDTLVNYASKPVTIKVNPLPEPKPKNPDNPYNIVGQFSLKDSILTKDVAQGKVVHYEVTISGRGLAYPITPPIIALNGVASVLIGEHCEDTTHTYNYYSSKSFLYALRFDKSGHFDLSQAVKVNTYDPILKRTIMLSAKSPINVLDGHSKEKLPAPLFSRHDNMIVVDMSQSMMIEDYQPHRLGAAIAGISRFLSNRNKCDMGMLAFGGNVVPIKISDSTFCYYTAGITPGLNGLTRGTAIGNALWTAIQSLKAGRIGKIVILGDGDNTAGNINPSVVIDLARQKGVKIYTIGVGHTGAVPFGKDPLGRKNMVENTFSDKDFKRIALQTGGKYFFGSDPATITAALREIFPE